MGCDRKGLLTALRRCRGRGMRSCRGNRHRAVESGEKELSDGQKKGGFGRVCVWAGEAAGGCEGGGGGLAVAGTDRGEWFDAASGGAGCGEVDGGDGYRGQTFARDGMA